MSDTNSLSSLNKNANTGASASRSDDRATYKKYYKVATIVILAIAGIYFANSFFTGNLNFSQGGQVAGVRTVENGTVVMRRGIPETFYVSGSVTLINPNNRTCLNISPDGRFDIRSSNGFRENVITPISGQKELVTVKVLDASDC